ncbi:hypothetical protein [Rhodoblastus sp.]|uniref:hypothetical protein n=1 Tax=Rhodoblastus sp. TaxID=1962975 RepID=UPI0035B4416D
MWNNWLVRNPIGLCLVGLYLPIASGVVLYSSLSADKKVLSIVASIAAAPAMILVGIFGNPNPLMTALIALGPLQIPMLLALSAIILNIIGYIIYMIYQLLATIKIYIVFPILLFVVIFNMFVRHVAP